MTKLEALEHAKRELEAYRLKVADKPFFQLEVDYLETVVEALEKQIAKKPIVEKMPTIDIVHCSECKHIGFPKYRDNIFVCNITGFTIEGNDYCSRGERKE